MGQETNNYKYRFFIKFGKLEHLENFQKKGQLYFSTMDSFRKMREENLIGDHLEGTTFIKQAGQGEITIKIGDKKANFPVDNLFLHPQTKINGNIFCLYGADETLLEKHTIKNKGSLHLAKVCGDYDHMLFINNPKGFMDKLKNHLDLCGWNYKYRPVKYIDFNKHHGPLDQFCKRIKYKGQNEFRVWLDNEINQPIKIEIGDISEFCTIGKALHHKNLFFEVL